MHLVLIGGISAQTAACITKITMIPATESQKELAQWYSAADAFITLSKEESFGKVSAEALACGTPVITVNSTANPELVGENCGIVIDDAEPETVLNALDKLFSWGKERMSASCRSFAEANYNMEGCIEQVYRLYSDLLKIGKGDAAC